MKKFIIAALLVATIGTSAFAADGNTVKVSGKISNSFQAKFNEAKNVQWTQTDAFTRATFQLNGQTVDAYYNYDGEAIGHSRRIGVSSLPANALTNINKNYANYTVKEAIEFERDGEKTFYVSLTNGKEDQILEINIYGRVSTFRPEK